MKKEIVIIVLSALLLLLNSYRASAREKKPVTKSPALYEAIAAQDSMLFAAYNNQDIQSIKAFFAPGIEWFKDNNGLLDYNTVVTNLEGLFSRDGKLTRTLLKNSLEIYPVKNYGAIETGVHRFRHMENGKQIVGTFKFLMIWKKQDDKWLVTKVVSYDH